MACVDFFCDPNRPWPGSSCPVAITDSANHPKNKARPTRYSSQSLSAAFPSGSERHFYDGHDRKVDALTSTQASLLRPWITCFTMIISAWYNLTSSKAKKAEAKFQRRTRKQRQLLRESGFVTGIAPPSLSRDRMIKMKKLIKSIT